MRPELITYEAPTYFGMSTVELRPPAADKRIDKAAGHRA
jgi:hypothetical protein